MSGRKYSAASEYRYGFNGKENDNEVKGEGNQQDYGMRIYDPRLGKFLSLDPLSKGYPWFSPYHFAGNSPIANVDLDGAEPLKGTVKSITAYHSGKVVVASSITIKVQVINKSSIANSDLALHDLNGTIKSGFIDKISGVHTADITSSHKLNTKTGKADVTTQYLQNITYQTEINYLFEVIPSEDKISNDAIVVAVVDDIKDNKGQDAWGIVAPMQAGGIALVKAEVLRRDKISTVGSKVVNHEIAHTFGAADVKDRANLMDYGNGTNLTEAQIVNMLRSAVGNWGQLWNTKKEKVDLDFKVTAENKKELKEMMDNYAR